MIAVAVADQQRARQLAHGEPRVDGDRARQREAVAAEQPAEPGRHEAAAGR